MTFTKIPNNLFKQLEDKTLTKTEFNMMCLVYKYQNDNKGLQCSLSYGMAALCVSNRKFNDTTKRLLEDGLLIKCNNGKYYIGASHRVADTKYFKIDNSLFSLLKDKKITANQFTIMCLISKQANFGGLDESTKVSKQTRISRNTVSSDLKKLIAMDLIVLQDKKYKLLDVSLPKPQTQTKSAQQMVYDRMSLHRKVNGFKNDETELKSIIVSLKKCGGEISEIRKILCNTCPPISAKNLAKWSEKDNKTPEEVKEDNQSKYDTIIDSVMAEMFPLTDVKNIKAKLQHDKYMEDFPPVDLDDLPEILKSAPITYSELFEEEEDKQQPEQVVTTR